MNSYISTGGWSRGFGGGGGGGGGGGSASKQKEAEMQSLRMKLKQDIGSEDDEKTLEDLMRDDVYLFYYLVC